MTLLNDSRPSSRRRKFLYNKLLDIQGPTCHYCEVVFETGIKSRRMTLDHVVPLVSGGTSELSNLVLSCLACNGLKGDLSAEAFLASELCQARRATILGYVEAHRHQSILYTKEGNWSCLCGEYGTRQENPENVECILYRYVAFYRPD